MFFDRLRLSLNGYSTNELLAHVSGQVN